MSGTSGPGGDKFQTLRQAGGLFERKRFAEARAMLEPMQRASDADLAFRAWGLTSAALFAEQRLEDALSAAESAIATMPPTTPAADQALASQQRSAVLAALGRDAEAAEAVRSELTLRASADGWGRYGRLLTKAGHPREAVAAYNEALRLTTPSGASERVALLVLKAHAHHAAQQYTQVLATTRQVIEVDGEQADAWGMQGTALGELGRYREAVVACERALQLAPEQANAWSAKANALYMLGQLQEARAASEHALRVASPAQKPWMQWTHARVLAQLVATGELAPSPDLLAEPELHGETVWTDAAIMLRRSKRYDDALRACERAFTLNPESAEAARIRAAILLVNQKRFPEAFGAVAEAFRRFRRQQRGTSANNNSRGRGDVR